jgi:hypothetical protein
MANAELRPESGKSRGGAIAFTFAAISTFALLACEFPLGQDFLATTIFSSLVFHLWLRPKWKELGPVFGAALILGLVRLFVVQPESTSSVSLWLSMIGFSSMMVMGAKIPWVSSKRGEYIRAFSYSFGFFLFLLASTIALLSVTALTPSTLDANLIRFDKTLRFVPEIWLSQVVLNSHAATTVMRIVYDALPIEMAVVCASSFETSKKTLTALGLAGVAGTVLYVCYPAIGPLAQNQSAPLRASTFRNVMPSLHFAWAILLYWSTRETWVRWTAAIFAVLMVFATMGLGFHYFIDLVVAVPFAALVWHLTERDFGACAAPAAVVCAWLLALRYFVERLDFSGGFNWVLIALTVFPFLVMRRVKPPVRANERDAVESSVS